MIMNNHSVNPKAKTMFFIILNRCSKQSDSFVQILLGGKMVPNVVIQNYPHLSKEMKNGHKNELFGKSYLIRNHRIFSLVHTGPYFSLLDQNKTQKSLGPKCGKIQISLFLPGFGHSIKKGF